MGFFVKRCIEFQLYGQIYNLLDGADQGPRRLSRVVYQGLINLRFRARAPLRLKMFHHFRIFSPAKFSSQSARIRHMYSLFKKKACNGKNSCYVQYFGTYSCYLCTRKTNTMASNLFKGTFGWPIRFIAMAPSRWPRSVHAGSTARSMTVVRWHGGPSAPTATRSRNCLTFRSSATNAPTVTPLPTARISTRTTSQTGCSIVLPSGSRCARPARCTTVCWSRRFPRPGASARTARRHA